MSKIERVAAAALAWALATCLIASSAAAQASPPAARDAPGAAAGVVNINTADAEQLALLPRIGPAVAQRILEHREKNGPFKSAADLMLVRGVGERTFELLEPHIALTGKTTLTEKVRVARKPKPAEGDS